MTRSQSKSEPAIDMSLQDVAKIKDAFKELTNNIKTGMNPQEAAGLEPQFLEGLYAEAYHLYNTGKFTEASHIFSTLILMNSTEFKYVLGLAACHHLLKDYESAIKVYTVASVINPYDPLPYYHSSDCYIQLQDLTSAFISLEMTLKMAGDKAEFEKIKERSLLSLEGVKKELKKLRKQEELEEANIQSSDQL